MPTAIETTTAIQDKVYAGIQASQRAVLDSAKTWSDTVETVFAKLPEYASATPTPPSQLLENAYGFTQKVLTSQREFLSQLFEATVPTTRAPAAGAKATPRS